MFVFSDVFFSFPLPFFVPLVLFEKETKKRRVEKQIYDRKKNNLKKKQPEMITFVNQEMYGTNDGRTGTISSSDA